MQVLLWATEAQQHHPLRETIAAPLVPITNRPVMAYSVELLARAGVKHIMVSVCDSAGQVMSHFGNGRTWGVQFEYLVQRETTGLVGLLQWAAPRSTETLLVLRADAVLDLDIEAALAEHRARQSAVTAILHRHAEANVPVVALDQQCHLQPSSNAEQTYALTGAFLIEPRSLPQLANIAVNADLVQALRADGQPVLGYVTEGYWNALATLEAVQEAQRVFLYSAYDAPATAPTPRVRFPSIDGQQIAPGIWVGPNHAIHPHAKIAAPVCIGTGCLIGEHVELGPETVLGPQSIVDDGATVLCSTVLARTYIGQLVHLADRIVDRTAIFDPQSQHRTAVVDPFLLTEVLIKRPRQLHRVLTLGAAGLLLLLTLPLLLIVGVLVSLTSGRRIIRHVPRYGRRATSDGGRGLEVFSMYQFCTAYPDGRPTPLGPWLKRWYLHYLPSLWNVFTGDLNLVGVKPLTIDEASQLTEAWHNQRNDAVVGLFGLWFVQTSRRDELDNVLVADAYYAALHTWRDNVRILAETPGAWLRRARQSTRSSAHGYTSLSQPAYKGEVKS